MSRPAIPTHASTTSPMAPAYIVRKTRNSVGSHF
jgi:hypothetical protein